MESDTNHGASPIETRRLSWLEERTVYLTLDFECDFGTALSRNTYEAVDYVDEFVDLLESTDMPLTCFVQTELLDRRPEAVEKLRECDQQVNFHPHSHTHSKRDATSMGYEITRSTDRFTEFFGQSPVGYRFPNGNVRDTDYRLLSEEGYGFDASVFPTWRPGHFNNTHAATVPTYLRRYDLFEMPFTVLSPSIPIPTGLSYCRFFGRPLTNYLVRAGPSSVVFNVHLHDLATPSSAAGLSPLYRALYSRNEDGLTLLREVLTRYRQRGYGFDTLDSVHNTLRERLTTTV